MMSATPTPKQDERFNFENIFQLKEEDIASLKQHISNLKPHENSGVFYLKPEFIATLENLIKHLSKTLTANPKQKLSPQLKIMNTLIVGDTERLIKRLQRAGDEVSRCQHIVVAYAKKVRSYAQQTHQAGSIWDIVSDLLYLAIGLELYELDIFDLDKQIERLEKISHEKKSLHTQFVLAAKNLRQELVNNIKQQCANQQWTWEISPRYLNKDDILNCAAIKLCFNTTKTLAALKYHNDSCEQDIKILQNYTKQFKREIDETPGYKNFSMGVTLLAFAGLGFFAGTLLGLYGALICGGIGGIVTIPYGICAGVKSGVDFGKKHYGLTKDTSLRRLLLFKPNILTETANIAGEKGLDFLHPETKPTPSI